jgi:hypothetical protein
MPKTAEVFSSDRPQVFQVPEVLHMKRAGGDFEKLFELLAELGPASEQFMLNTCDPLLEAEDIFGTEEDRT